MTTIKGLGKILMGVSAIEHAVDDPQYMITNAAVKMAFGKDCTAEMRKDLDGIWYKPWRALGVEKMVHAHEGKRILQINDVGAMLPAVREKYPDLIILPRLYVQMQPGKRGAKCLAEHRLEHAVLDKRTEELQQALRLDFSGEGGWDAYALDKITYTHLDFSNGLCIITGYDFVNDKAFFNDEAFAGAGCGYLIGELFGPKDFRISPEKK